MAHRDKYGDFDTNVKETLIVNTDKYRMLLGLGAMQDKGIIDADQAVFVEQSFKKYFDGGNTPSLNVVDIVAGAVENSEEFDFSEADPDSTFAAAYRKLSSVIKYDGKLSLIGFPAADIYRRKYDYANFLANLALYKRLPDAEDDPGLTSENNRKRQVVRSVANLLNMKQDISGVNNAFDEAIEGRKFQEADQFLANQVTGIGILAAIVDWNPIDETTKPLKLDLAKVITDDEQRDEIMEECKAIHADMQVLVLANKEFPDNISGMTDEQIQALPQPIQDYLDKIKQSNSKKRQQTKKEVPTRQGLTQFLRHRVQKCVNKMMREIQVANPTLEDLTGATTEWRSQLVEDPNLAMLANQLRLNHPTANGANVSVVLPGDGSTTGDTTSGGGFPPNTDFDDDPFDKDDDLPKVETEMTPENYMVVLAAEKDFVKRLDLAIKYRVARMRGIGSGDRQQVEVNVREYLTNKNVNQPEVWPRMVANYYNYIAYYAYLDAKNAETEFSITDESGNPIKDDLSKHQVIKATRVIDVTDLHGGLPDHQEGTLTIINGDVPDPKSNYLYKYGIGGMEINPTAFGDEIARITDLLEEDKEVIYIYGNHDAFFMHAMTVINDLTWQGDTLETNLNEPNTKEDIKKILNWLSSNSGLETFEALGVEINDEQKAIIKSRKVLPAQFDEFVSLLKNIKENEVGQKFYQAICKRGRFSVVVNGVLRQHTLPVMEVDASGAYQIVGLPKPENLKNGSVLEADKERISPLEFYEQARVIMAGDDVPLKKSLLTFLVKADYGDSTNPGFDEKNQLRTFSPLWNRNHDEANKYGAQRPNMRDLIHREFLKDAKTDFDIDKFIAALNVAYGTPIKGVAYGHVGKGGEIARDNPGGIFLVNIDNANEKGMQFPFADVDGMQTYYDHNGRKVRNVADGAEINVFKEEHYQIFLDRFMNGIVPDLTIDQAKKPELKVGEGLVEIFDGGIEPNRDQLVNPYYIDGEIPDADLDLVAYITQVSAALETAGANLQKRDSLVEHFIDRPGRGSGASRATTPVVGMYRDGTNFPAFNRAMYHDSDTAAAAHIAAEMAADPEQRAILYERMMGLTINEVKRQIESTGLLTPFVRNASGTLARIFHTADVVEASLYLENDLAELYGKDGNGYAKPGSKKGSEILAKLSGADENPKLLFGKEVLKKLIEARGIDDDTEYTHLGLLGIILEAGGRVLYDNAFVTNQLEDPFIKLWEDRVDQLYAKLGDADRTWSEEERKWVQFLAENFVDAGMVMAIVAGKEKVMALEFPGLLGGHNWEVVGTNPIYAKGTLAVVAHTPAPTPVVTTPAPTPVVTTPAPTPVVAPIATTPAIPPLPTGVIPPAGNPIDVINMMESPTLQDVANRFIRGQLTGPNIRGRVAELRKIIAADKNRKAREELMKGIFKPGLNARNINVVDNGVTEYILPVGTATNPVVEKEIKLGDKKKLGKYSIERVPGEIFDASVNKILSMPGHVINVTAEGDRTPRNFVLLDYDQSPQDLETYGLYSYREKGSQLAFPIISPDITDDEDEVKESLDRSNARALETALLFMDAKDDFIVVPKFKLNSAGTGLVLEVVTVDIRDMFASRSPLDRSRHFDDEKIVGAYLKRNTVLMRGIDPANEAVKKEVFINVVDYLFERAMVELLANPTFAGANINGTKEQILRDKLDEIKDNANGITQTGPGHDIELKRQIENAFALVQLMNLAARGGVYTREAGKDNAVNTLAALNSTNDLTLTDVYMGICDLYADGDAFLVNIPGIGDNQALLDLQKELTVAALKASGVSESKLMVLEYSSGQITNTVANYYKLDLEAFFRSELAESVELLGATAKGKSAAELTADLTSGFKNRFDDLLRPDDKKLDRHIQNLLWEGRNVLDFGPDGFADLDEIDRWASSRGGMLKDKDTFAATGAVGTLDPYFEAIYPDTLTNTATGVARSIESILRKTNPKDSDKTRLLRARSWVENQITAGELRAEVIKRLNLQQLNGNIAAVVQEFRDETGRLDNSKKDIIVLQLTAPNYWESRYPGVQPMRSIKLDATDLVPAVTGPIDYNHLGKASNPQIASSPTGFTVQVSPGVTVAVQTNSTTNATPTFSSGKKGSAYPYVDISQLKGITDPAIQKAEIERINAQFTDLALNEMDLFESRGFKVNRSQVPVFLPKLVVGGTGEVELTFVLINPDEAGFAKAHKQEMAALDKDKTYAQAAGRFRAAVAKDMVDKMLKTPQSMLDIVNEYKTATAGGNGLDVLDATAKVVTDQRTPKGLVIPASAVRLRELGRVLTDENFILSAGLIDMMLLSAQTSPELRLTELMRQLTDIRHVNAKLEAGVGLAGYDPLDQQKRNQTQAIILAELLPNMILLTTEGMKLNGKDLNIEQRVILAQNWLDQGLAGMDKTLIEEVKLSLTRKVVYRPSSSDVVPRYLKSHADSDFRGFGVGKFRLKPYDVLMWGKISPAEFDAQVLTEKEQLTRLYARDVTAQLRTEFATKNTMFDTATDLNGAVDAAISALGAKPFPAGEFLNADERRRIIQGLLTGEIVDYIPEINNPGVTADTLLAIIGTDGLVGKLKAVNAIDDVMFKAHIGKVATKIAREVYGAGTTADMVTIKAGVKALVSAKATATKIGDATKPDSAHALLITATDALTVAALESPTVFDKMAEHGLKPVEVAKLRSIMVEARNKRLKDSADAIRSKADKEAKSTLKIAREMLGVHKAKVKAEADVVAADSYADQKEREAALKAGDMLSQARITDNEQGWLRKRIPLFRKTISMSEYSERQFEKLNEETRQAKKVFEDVITKAAAANLLRLDPTGPTKKYKDLAEAGIFAADDVYKDPVKLEALLKSVMADMPGFISPAEVDYVVKLITANTAKGGKKRIEETVVQTLVDKMRDPAHNQRLAELCFDGMLSTDSISTRLGRLSEILTNNFEDKVVDGLKGNANRGAAGRIYELAKAMGLNDDGARKAIEGWANEYKNNYSAAGKEEEMKFDAAAKTAINEYFADGKLGTKDGYKPREFKLDLGGKTFNKQRVALKRDLNKFLPPEMKIFEADTATGRVFRSLLEDIANRTLENNDVKTYKKWYNRLGKFALETSFVIALPGVGIALRWGAREAAKTVLQWQRKGLEYKKDGKDRGFFTALKDDLTAVGRNLYILPRTALGISTFGMSEFYIAGTSFVWDVLVKNRKELNRTDYAVLMVAGIGSLVASTGLSFVGAEAGKSISKGGALAQAFGRFAGNQIGNFAVFSMFDALNNRRDDNKDLKERRVRQELLYKSRTFAYMAFGPMSLTNATLNNPDFKKFVDGISSPDNPIGKALQDINRFVFNAAPIFDNDKPSQVVGELHPINVGDALGVGLNNVGQNLGQGLGNAWGQFGDHMKGVFGPIGQGIGNAAQGVGNVFGGGNVQQQNVNQGGGGGVGGPGIFPLFQQLNINVQPNGVIPAGIPQAQQQPGQPNWGLNLFNNLFNNNNQPGGGPPAPVNPIGPLGPVPNPNPNPNPILPVGGLFGVGGPLGVGAGAAVAPAVPAGANGDWVFVGKSSDNNQIFANVNTGDFVEAFKDQNLFNDPANQQLKFPEASFTPNPANGDLVVPVAYTADLQHAMANGVDGDMDIIDGVNGPRLVFGGADGSMKIQQPVFGGLIEFTPEDNFGNGVPMINYSAQAQQIAAAAGPGPVVAPVGGPVAVVEESVVRGIELDRDGDGIPDVLDRNNIVTDNITASATAITSPVTPVTTGGGGVTPGVPVTPTGYVNMVNDADLVGPTGKYLDLNDLGSYRINRANTIDTIFRTNGFYSSLNSATPQEILAIAEYRADDLNNGSTAPFTVAYANDALSKIRSNWSGLWEATTNRVAYDVPTSISPTWLTEVEERVANMNGVTTTPGVTSPVVTTPPAAVTQPAAGPTVFLNNGLPITDPTLNTLINIAVAEGINPANRAQWGSFLDSLTPQEIDLLADGKSIPGRGGAAKPLFGGFFTPPVLAGNAQIPAGEFGSFVVTNDPVSGASAYNFFFLGASAVPNASGNYTLSVGIPFLPGSSIVLTNDANPAFVNNVLAKGGFLGLTAAGALMVGGTAFGVTTRAISFVGRSFLRVTGLARR